MSVLGFATAGGDGGGFSVTMGRNPTETGTKNEMGTDVLSYIGLMEGVGERLNRVIEALIQHERIEVYRTIDSLSRRLRQPDNGSIIVVLLAASREDVTNILSIADLLRNFRIILILPDRDSETIAKGHMLRPRFLSYLDSNFADVAAVLDKMLQSRGTASGP